MGVTPTDNESALGKRTFITVSILGIVLIVALIWSLSRALNNSSPQGSVAPTNETAAMSTLPSQAEVERQDMAEQQPATEIQAPVAAQSTVVPTKQNNDEVILQKAKTKSNQRIVERMTQYVKDHPNRDTLSIQEQIKQREKRDAQIK